MMTTSHTERIVDRLTRSCSLDRVFVAGREAGAISNRIRLLGGSVVQCDDHAMDAVTRRLSVDAGGYTTAVVCLVASAADAETARAFFVALSRATRAAYVQVFGDPGTARRPDGDGGRAWWDEQALACGFRRHPLFPRLMPYGQLDARSAEPWLLLEAVSDGPAVASETTSGAGAASIDELQSSTPDSEALLSRYARATDFIRRHDRVLDLDVGGGSGLAVVALASLPDAIIGITGSQADAEHASRQAASTPVACEIRVGDPSDLAWLADESVDVVLACRLLSPGFWSPETLTEIRRVLTPGGRLICGVPGAPHEPDGPAVGEHISGVFLMERLLVQTSRHESSRSWIELDPADTREAVIADWWLVIAMKDPTHGSRATYCERRYPYPAFPGGSAPTAYIDTFDNPWLHSSVFSLGVRITHGPLLERVCRQIVGTNARSNDAAAAVCVLGYRLLEAHSTDARSLAGWFDDAAHQLAGLTDHEPATLRWRVSLRFITGRLAMRIGDRDRALDLLRTCMNEDATRFSSLLATKTVEAAYWVGCLEARHGKFDAAAAAWRRGLEIARACLVVEAHLAPDMNSPVELFGFREFPQVFDIAGRCAAGLDALSAGAHWETRLRQLTPYASVVAAQHTATQTTRWAAEDECLARTTQLLDVARSVSEGLLRQIIHSCHLMGRKLLVWGAGAGGARVRCLAEALGGIVDAVIDSDPAKRGVQVTGLQVMGPEALESDPYRGSFVLVGSMAAGEIEERLVALGLTRYVDFMVVEAGTTSVACGQVSVGS